MTKRLGKTLFILNCYKNCFTTISILIILNCSLSLINVVQAIVCKNVLDSATSISPNLKINIILLGIVLLVTFFIKSINPIITAYLSNKIENSIQRKLFCNIINSSWNVHSKYHSVDLLTRLTNDSKSISSTLSSTIPQIISLLVMLISSVVVLFKISLTMAIVAIIVFPILILLSLIYARIQKKYYIKIQNLESKYNSFIQETLINSLIVKCFSLEKIKQEQIVNIQKKRINLSLKNASLGAFSGAFLTLSTIIGYFAVFSWGAYNLSNGIQIFGSLTATLQLFGTIQTPIYGLAYALPQIISCYAASTRLQELNALPLEVHNKSIILPKKNLDININNVTYGYDEKKIILEDVNLELHSGEIVGLIGPSGEGKTTLIRLILSLISPVSGEITINGTPINPIHRNLISYVPQGNTLFSGSIYDNLILDDTSLTKEEIIVALKNSSAYKFVSQLEDKLDTKIGEKNDGLSEGQAQRLTIARAFLRKRPILILDEATSSLDPDTELKILNSIKNLDYRPLCIIITHRLSALNICHKVYKLENRKLNLYK